MTYVKPENTPKRIIFESIFEDRISTRRDPLLFLIHQDKIVYICNLPYEGFSLSEFEFKHKMKFDSFTIRDVKGDSYNWLAKFIIMFKPKYNKYLPHCDKYKHIEAVKSIYGLSDFLFNELSKKYKLKRYLKDYIYIPTLEKILMKYGIMHLSSKVESNVTNLSIERRKRLETKDGELQNTSVREKE